MEKRLLKILQFIFFLGLGLVLIYASVRKLDIHSLAETLVRGDYRIAVPIVLISLTGYYFRILRWKLMLNKMGEKSRKRSLYASLCMGYLVSFVVPRLGEISRALILKKTDAIKVDITLISIVAERILDTLMLFLLMIIGMVFYYSDLFLIVQNGYADIDIPIWILVLISVFLVSAFGYLAFRRKWLRGIIYKYKPVLSGLKLSLLLPSFWFYTLAIWFCYFLMTYLWFYLYPETTLLTWQNAYIVMLVGSFGRSIPVQGGGMGAYHFLVSRMLLLFGINLITGNAVALVIHGAQAVITFCTGSISYLWMMYDISVRNKENQT